MELELASLKDEVMASSMGSQMELEMVLPMAEELGWIRWAQMMVLL